MNSSILTHVQQCTLEDTTYARCSEPETFVLYDLLSLSRVTKRVGYATQCALEYSYNVEQNEMWSSMPVEPTEVYENEAFSLTVTVNGTALAFLPLCDSEYLNISIVNMNFTLGDLNHLTVSIELFLPIIQAEFIGTVTVRSELFWDYERVENVYSSASTTAVIYLEFDASDFMLERPSKNGHTAIQSTEVAARLNITDLGDISDFYFTMSDSEFCDGTYFGLNLCPYIEDYILGSYKDDMHDLALIYAKEGFAAIAPELTRNIQNATYTEIDYWGIEASCAIVGCDGISLTTFAERLKVIAWTHVLLIILVAIYALCCCCALCCFGKSNRIMRYEVMMESEEVARITRWKSYGTSR